MKAALEIISPTVAKDMLERNGMNRKFSTTTAERYAADMRDDQWVNNGQGIILSEDGELLDGQHRLRAILISQKTVSMMVVRGVPKGSFVTMDSGKSRNLADLLSIEGYAHANTLSGVARSVYAYAGGASQSYNPTKATLNGFVSKHSYLKDVAALVHRDNKRFPRVPLAAVLFLGNEGRNLDEEVEAFVEGVLYGEGLRKGDARHTLREWLLGERMRSRNKVATQSIFAATARAWNAYAQGKELSQIKALGTPTHRSLNIFGFGQYRYPEVPDIQERSKDASMKNIRQYHAKRAASKEATA